MASLKKNVIANYAGQVYLTVIGIVMVPAYVGYMGAEAYGLVGFFSLVQSWFQLLDIGLSSTMVRETARFQGGAIDALTLRRLLRGLEAVFVGVSAVGCLAIVGGSNLIATRWLKVEHLPPSEARQAVALMGIIVALRLVSGLYRGAINGFEKLIWLNGFNSAIATSRFVLVLLVFKFVGTRPVHFFTFQMVVAVVELLVLVAQTYRLLPRTEPGTTTAWAWEPLRANLQFSLTIAFTGLVWVLVTQTDKLVLSKLLSLTEYAYYSLAVLVAGGVTTVIGPVRIALLPRMAKLFAADDHAGLVRLYRNATQAVAVVAVPASIVLAAFAERIVGVWTGDAIIAHQAAPILTLYGVGNGFMALAAFPYYLQFAHGNLRLHLIGNAVFVVVLIPALIWATQNHGAMGAGWVWLITNGLFFFLWTPFIHRLFLKGRHLSWLFHDVFPTVVGPALMAAVLRSVVVWPSGRIQAGVALVLASACVMACSVVGSSWVRGQARAWVSARSDRRRA